MKIMIVGSGAREHAIAWSLKSSPRVEGLITVPGNAGTAAIGDNFEGSPEDLDGLARTAENRGIDLTIVGPEAPLAKGIVDMFMNRGLPVFGPTKAAARIEASKAFAKELMAMHGVPCPKFKVYRDYDNAKSFLAKHDGPVVVKADGLSAGKGVVVCEGREQALQALSVCMKSKAFGAAGDTVVVEEYLEGPEVSVFAFSDGEHLSPLVAACDYKRLLDGDEGPNTGGMGSYSPPEFWTPQLEDRVRKEIMVPVVGALRDAGTPYQGALYAGLMVTTDGPKVLEFNCRLGDPEAQVILPMLKSDLLDVLLASVDGGISDLSIEWAADARVGVVMASGGYPSEYATGIPVSGVEDVDSDVEVFHGGTRHAGDGENRRIVTSGGRVLTVVGRGVTVAQARERAYDNIKRVRFQSAYYRKDIALLPRMEGG